MFPIFPIVLLLLDLIYLSLTGKYAKKAIGIKKINYLAMVICYIIILIGYYYFVALPRKTAEYAFLLGVVIYGVYETTNWATLENWPIWLVVTDTLWGGVLFYLTTVISRKLRFMKLS